MAPPEPKGPVREHDDPTLMVFGASAAWAKTTTPKNIPTNATTSIFLIIKSSFLS
jgi:hypothetical protein